METMNMAPFIQLLFNILIPMIIGIGVLYYLPERIKKDKHITRNGLPSEGIIYDFAEPDSHGNRLDDLKDPIIRFVTQKGEWITERSHVAHSGMKLGDAVKVIYDPADPKTFLVETGLSMTSLYILCCLAGVGGIGWGLYKLVEYLIS